MFRALRSQWGDRFRGYAKAAVDATCVGVRISHNEFVPSRLLKDVWQEFGARRMAGGRPVPHR